MKSNLPIKARPYAHQIEAYAFALNLFGLGESQDTSSGAALLMEMGTGKTITAIAIAGALHKAGKAKRLLIVALYPFSVYGKRNLPSLPPLITVSSYSVAQAFKR